MARLYLHEAQRVYGDKLVDTEDFETFYKLQREVVKKTLEEVTETDCFRKPNIFCHFSHGTGDPKYAPIEGWVQINKILVEALESYNELNSVTNKYRH